MEDNPRVVNSFEIAFILARIDFIMILFSIIITFLFWFAISIFFLLLHTSGVLTYAHIKYAREVLAIFGLSPILLATATWRISKKLLCLCINKYAESHVETYPS